MTRWLACLIFLAFAALAPAAGAQDIERPAPFDSAGRIVTLTPQLAARFSLTDPWTVTGPFVEARLFSRSGGGFVIVVQRPDGLLERIPLDDSQRSALAEQIATAARRLGGATSGAERADIISEPAGGAFTRNQTAAAAFIWGPALASLTDEGSTASGVYLGTVGATFFIASSIASDRSVTRAMNHMASDGALRGAGIGLALVYVIDGDDASDDARALGIVAGSLTATGLGFAAGRPLTDSEASGCTWGSTFSSAVAVGGIGTAGGWQGDGHRGEMAGTVAAALAGYPLGLSWVRHSKHAITAGDITTISTASLIGTAAAGALVPDDPEGGVVSAALTSGFVGGAFAGSRLFARPYDLTQSQGNQISLGALAGALIAITPAVVDQSESRQLYLGLGSAGAVAGMLITRSMLHPERVGGPAQAGGVGHGASRRAPGLALHAHPGNLALLAAGSGRLVPLISGTFP